MTRGELFKGRIFVLLLFHLKEKLQNEKNFALKVSICNVEASFLSLESFVRLKRRAFNGLVLRKCVLVCGWSV